MLFDTDILIWCLRGNKAAQAIVYLNQHRFISAITHMEVTRGLKNKSESFHWKSLLSEFNIQIIPINESISAKAMYWMEEFTLSHGLSIPDALIGATADTHSLILTTSNTKDFKFLPSIILNPFKL